MMTIRTPYARSRVVTPVPGESQTDSSFGNDTDVNNIVERFARTGQFPGAVNPLEPQYGDVTGLQQPLTELIERGRQAAEELKQAKANADADAAKEAADKLTSLEKQIAELKASAPGKEAQPDSRDAEPPV